MSIPSTQGQQPINGQNVSIEFPSSSDKGQSPSEKKVASTAKETFKSIGAFLGRTALSALLGVSIIGGVAAAAAIAIATGSAFLAIASAVAIIGTAMLIVKVATRGEDDKAAYN